jgi:protocatechuate 3,4-dioxygenase alpha subunit
VPGFRGFGRCETDESGRYRVLTVKPGALPSPDGGTEAPHLNISVLARGLLDRVVTRLFFPDEPELNRADPVLSALPDDRRATLLAEPDGDGLRFDIRLQGDGETVFFDV